MRLLDTDVLIDCLRGLPAAGTWLRESANEVVGVPALVAMELVVGCRNRDDLLRTQALLSHFQVLYPEAAEIKYALDLLFVHRLEHGVSIPDCIIAAMALMRGLALYTFNSKHYQAFSGIDVVEPYDRSVR